MSVADNVLEAERVVEGQMGKRKGPAMTVEVRMKRWRARTSPGWASIFSAPALTLGLTISRLFIVRIY